MHGSSVEIVEGTAMAGSGASLPAAAAARSAFPSLCGRVGGRLIRDHDVEHRK